MRRQSSRPTKRSWTAKSPMTRLRLQGARRKGGLKFRPRFSAAPLVIRPSAADIAWTDWGLVDALLIRRAAADLGRRTHWQAPRNHRILISGLHLVPSEPIQEVRIQEQRVELVSRRSTSRRRLPRLAGGIIGSTSAHSASVRSLGYRRTRRSAARRCSGFHISGHPELTIRVPHNESQMIYPTQQHSGSALRGESVRSARWLHLQAGLSNAQMPLQHSATQPWPSRVQ